MKRHIDVTFEALGQRWRVVGGFTPALPARRDSPAESATWDDVRVSMVVGDYESPDLSEFLDDLRVPGSVGTALDHVREMAELRWLRERDVSPMEA